MADSDGSIVFKTDLDNSNLEKQLRKAEQRVESLKNKIENSEIEKTVIEKQMERTNKAIESSRARISELKSQIESMGGVDGATGSQLRTVTELTKKINEQYAAMNKQYDNLDRLDEAWHKVNDKAEAYTSALQKVEGRSARLAAEYAKSQQSQNAGSLGVWQRVGGGIKQTFSNIASSVRDHMANAARQSVAPWQSFAVRVGSLLKSVFVFGVILKGLNAIKNAIGSMLSKNTQFNASVENLKATLCGFLGSMLQAVLPVLVGVVNTLTAVFQKLAEIIDSIFGTNIAQGIAQQRQESVAEVEQSNAEKQAAYDEQVASAREQHERQLAEAEERRAKAAQKVEKAQRKANQQLLAFDELNKLTEDSTEDATDALEDYADSIEEPDYSSIAAPELETPWTENLVPDAGVLTGVLDWLDMLRDRILNDVEGPFARIREGLELIGQGWAKLLEGIRTGNLGLIFEGIRDMIVGAVFVIEGSINAFLDWLDEMTGGRFHLFFEGLKMMVTGLSELIAGILTGDIPRAINGLMMIVDGVHTTLKGIVDAVVGFIRGGVEGIFDYLSKRFPAFSDFFQGAKKFIVGIIDSIGEFLKTALEANRLGIKGVIDIVVGMFTLNGDRIKQGIDGVVNGINTLVRGARDFVIGILSNVFDTYRNLVTSAFDLLSRQFPQFSSMFETMKRIILAGVSVLQGTITGVVDQVYNAVKGFVDGAGRMLKGLGDVIFGVFEGSGDKIVRGLKEIINGFIDVLAGVLRGVIHGVIDFMNGIIGALCQLPGVEIPSITIPGFSLTYLANGAVIPPNREFMAVLGDQRHGNNIETPESLMRQVVREETGPLLADVVAALVNAGQGSRAQDVVLVVGRKELARETIRGVQELRETGELGMSGLAFS